MKVIGTAKEIEWMKEAIQNRMTGCMERFSIHVRIFWERP